MLAAGVIGVLVVQGRAPRQALTPEPPPPLVLLGTGAGASPSSVAFRISNGGSRALLLMTMEVQAARSDSPATKRYEALHLLGSRAPWIEWTPVCEVGSNTVFEIALPKEPFWRARVQYQSEAKPGSWLAKVRRVMQARSWRVWNARDWDSVQYTDWTLVQELIPTVPMVPGRNQNLPHPAGRSAGSPARAGLGIPSLSPLSSRPGSDP